MTAKPGSLQDLDVRSREIFRQLVETYLDNGDPVGSRTLSRQLSESLSPASIRNVMSDLEMLGLIAAPHVSAGRVPTEQGLRLFLDGFLQIGDIDPEERRAIEGALESGGRGIEQVLDDATAALSGLSQCAGLVVTQKRDAPIEHIELSVLSDGRALAVIVTNDGSVENRLFRMPPGMTPSAAEAATNFLNAHLRNMTLVEAQSAIRARIAASRADLDAASQALIESGVAEWSGSNAGSSQLIVRGLSNLLGDGRTLDEIESVRMLFDDIERKENLAHLLDLAESGEGVRVFIGAESKFFSHSGSALVISPYMDGNRRIIGALGVIGPTRLNYARIMPIVDFTAKMVSKLVSTK